MQCFFWNVLVVEIGDGVAELFGPCPCRALLGFLVDSRAVVVSSAEFGSSAVLAGAVFAVLAVPIG